MIRTFDAGEDQFSRNCSSLASRPSTETPPGDLLRRKAGFVPSFQSDCLQSKFRSHVTKPTGGRVFVRKIFQLRAIISGEELTSVNLRAKPGRIPGESFVHTFPWGNGCNRPEVLVPESSSDLHSILVSAVSAESNFAHSH